MAYAGCWPAIEYLIEPIGHLKVLAIPVTCLFLKSGLAWERIALFIYHGSSRALYIILEPVSKKASLNTLFRYLMMLLLYFPVRRGI